MNSTLTNMMQRGKDKVARAAEQCCKLSQAMEEFKIALELKEQDPTLELPQMKIEDFVEVKRLLVEAHQSLFDAIAAAKESYSSQDGISPELVGRITPSITSLKVASSVFMDTIIRNIRTGDFYRRLGAYIQAETFFNRTMETITKISGDLK